MAALTVGFVSLSVFILCSLYGPGGYRIILRCGVSSCMSPGYGLRSDLVGHTRVSQALISAPDRGFRDLFASLQRSIATADFCPEFQSQRRGGQPGGFADDR